MIKYVGLISILASAFLFAREYEKNEKKRLLECSEFLRLLIHIKNKISCFLMKKSEFIASFDSESEEVSEFLLKAKEEELSEAFRYVSDKLSLGAEKEILLSFFENFGRGYKDGELALAESAISSFKLEKERVEKESEKTVKTVKTLAAAISLGLVILLL